MVEKPGLCSWSTRADEVTPVTISDAGYLRRRWPKRTGSWHHQSEGPPRERPWQVAAAAISGSHDQSFTAQSGGIFAAFPGAIAICIVGNVSKLFQTLTVNYCSGIPVLTATDIPLCVCCHVGPCFFRTKFYKQPAWLHVFSRGRLQIVQLDMRVRCFRHLT